MVEILLENGYVRVIEAKHGYFLYNTNDRFVGKSWKPTANGVSRNSKFCSSSRTGRSGLRRRRKYRHPHSSVREESRQPRPRPRSRTPKARFPSSLWERFPQRLLIVVCLNKGAGKDRGSVKVPVLDPAVEQNFSAMNIKGHGQGDSIEVATIDSFEPNQCKLIKIDVEGIEADVLDGAEITIKRLQPILFVENIQKKNPCLSG